MSYTNASPKTIKTTVVTAGSRKVTVFPLTVADIVCVVPAASAAGKHIAKLGFANLLSYVSSLDTEVRYTTSILNGPRAAIRARSGFVTVAVLISPSYKVAV